MSTMLIYSNNVTPTIAVAIASNQALNLELSPIFTKSETAPIVQKFVLLTTYPSINPKIDV